MGFRLVPKSVTLNDLERRYFAELAVGLYYLKVVARYTDTFCE